MREEFQLVQNALKGGNQEEIKKVVFSILKNHGVWIYQEPVVITNPWWNEDWSIELNVYVGALKIYMIIRNIDDNEQSDSMPFEYDIEGINITEVRSYE